MKIVLIPIGILAALYGAVVLPVLGQGKIVAKAGTPAQIRRYYADRERVAGTLDAFRRGDPGSEARAEAAVRGLPASDERRLDFARVLADQGRARDAYDVARPKARFGEFSLPDDAEMALYARLAEKAGHPEEAAWARERMGEDGHFRVWVRGEQDTYAIKRGSRFPTGKRDYKKVVDLDMSRGLDLYPRHHEEIEALRRGLLSAP